jgi:hypothetical protein
MEAAVIKFVIVNDRTPARAPFFCACCSEKLEDGYIHESGTGLKYCDLTCFGFSEKMAIVAIESRSRLAS